jgi:2'-5' RNA ligase
VTLAYLRRPQSAAVARWLQANNLLHEGPFMAASFGLYSSELGRDGSGYRLERVYPLTD